MCGEVSQLGRARLRSQTHHVTLSTLEHTTLDHWICQSQTSPFRRNYRHLLLITLTCRPSLITPALHKVSLCEILVVSSCALVVPGRSALVSFSVSCLYIMTHHCLCIPQKELKLKLLIQLYSPLLLCGAYKITQIK